MNFARVDVCEEAPVKSNGAAKSNIDVVLAESYPKLLAGAVSLVLWAAIVISGRMIAYNFVVRRRCGRRLDRLFRVGSELARPFREGPSKVGPY